MSVEVLNRLYVSAFFCERVLREQDGAITAIRMIDYFDVKVPDIGASQFVPRLEVHLVIIFRSIRAVRVPWIVRITDPNGSITEQHFPDIDIAGGAIAATAVVNLFINGVLEGVHVYEIIVEGSSVACVVPLAIRHTKVPTSAPPQRTS
jgi:hypothetical protein